MALDWGKEISFTGLRRRKPKAKAVFPSKTYINLAVRDKRELNLRSVLPKALLLVVAVALFCKFGIFDFYDRVGARQAELASQQRVLNDLELQLADYDEVKAEYDMYESTRIVSAEGTVSVRDATDLVDRYISPTADVTTLDIRNNTVSLSLANVTLEKAGRIVSTLYEQPIVDNVTVSTAATEKDASNKDVIATMVITLKVAEES